jgi:murein DD-endopeptidase MepM/ murein hydrolase activator NlpD
MKKLELYYPVKPWTITQKFGGNGDWYRKNGIDIKGHNGYDIKTYHGQPVFASHDGEVVYAGSDNFEGYGVVIRSILPFSDGFYYKTIYWHLIPKIPVRVGTKVKAGDLIGYSDNTGFSTGDHLHFAVKPVKAGSKRGTFYNAFQDNGYKGAIDPTPFFNGKFAVDIQIRLIGSAINIINKLINIMKGNKV